MGEVRIGDTQRFKGSNRDIVILAMCFETDITFVISELKAKASLREFTGVHDVPERISEWGRCSGSQWQKRRREGMGSA